MYTDVSHNSIPFCKVLTSVNIIDDLLPLGLFPVLGLRRQTKRTRLPFSPSLPLHLPIPLSIPLLLLSLESRPDGLVDDPFARELAVAGVEGVEFAIGAVSTRWNDECGT